MKKCIYKKIIVIGCGMIATTVMNYVVKSREKHGYSCVFVKYANGMPSPIKKYAKKQMPNI